MKRIERSRLRGVGGGFVWIVSRLRGSWVFYATMPILSLMDAISEDRLEEFIAQEEARGVVPTPDNSHGHLR